MDDPRLKAAVDASLDRRETQRTNPPELEPMSEGLFPLTPAERLDILATFVKRERGIRAGMLVRHSDDRESWQRKVAAADEALHHIEQLRKELGR